MATLPLEIIGWVGTAFVLGAYFLLQVRKLGPTSRSYNAFNLIGAFFIALNSYFNGALPSSVLSVAWMAVAIYGIANSVRSRLQETR